MAADRACRKSKSALLYGIGFISIALAGTSGVMVMIPVIRIMDWSGAVGRMDGPLLNGF